MVTIRSPRLAARLAGITWAPSSMAANTPDPAIAQFVAHLEAKRYSPKTVANYRSELRLAEEALARPLTTATREHVNAYMATLSRGDYKASTIHKKQACLREFYRWALKHGHVTDDPTLDLEGPRIPERLPIHLTDAQIDQLFAVLHEGSPLAFREAVIVKTLYFTGMRASELVGLTWERINLASGELAVIGKGNKERRIPIPSPLVELLTRYKASHHTGTGRVLLHYGAEKPITYDTVYRTVREALRRAGLGGMGFTPHKLRHTYATRLVNRGLAIDRIQKLLGHRQISTSQIYAHTQLGAETRDALERML